MKMNADRLSPRIVSAFILIFALAWTLSACGPNVTPTLFRPPTEVPSPIPVRASLTAGALTPNGLALTFTPAPSTGTPICSNNLTFLNDLTYPDGTVVLPGETMDKQWLVQNSGSCDWNDRYTLRFVGGDTLGAVEEVPLYPARIGARVALRVQFIAPEFAGTYESAWQAADPEGNLFGDSVFVLITVAQ